MNELSEKFIDFINNESCFKNLYVNKYNINYTFEAIISIKLFVESEKCNINENQEKLIFNCVLSIIHEHRNKYSEYLRNNLLRCINLTNNNFEQIAIYLTEKILNNYMLKLMVVGELKKFRDHLINVYIYRKNFNNINCEEHPMTTFIYLFNNIELLKGTSEYPNWLNIKQDLINWMRVGYAIIPRYEWQGKVEIIEA